MTALSTPSCGEYTGFIYSPCDEHSQRPVASRPPIKPVVWCGSALEAVRSFPDEARREAGFQLGQLQEGKAADDWKPMSTVGQGTIEIRIHTRHRAPCLRGDEVRRADLRTTRVREEVAEDTAARYRPRETTISSGSHEGTRAMRAKTSQARRHQVGCNRTRSFAASQGAAARCVRRGLTRDPRRWKHLCRPRILA